VRTLLLKATEGIDGIIHDGEVTGLSGPWVLFTDFGDSALQFELRAYVYDQNAKAGVASTLRFRIFELFKQAEINIPFPQNDVWVRNWPERNVADRPALGPGGLEAAARANNPT
jgi:small-conductance mechanosensitive channel